ncbi:MAG: hypothetical protein H7832_03180, partial [Magnetococcus sp. DMHC-6]
FAFDFAFDLGFASFKKQGDWGMQSPKVLTLLFVHTRSLVHRPHFNVVVADFAAAYKRIIMPFGQKIKSQTPWEGAVLCFSKFCFF